MLQSSVGVVKNRALSVSSAAAEEFADLAELAPGWRGEIVAKIDQSYCGWGLAVGDADNDGRVEFITQPGTSHVVVVKKL